VRLIAQEHDPAIGAWERGLSGITKVAKDMKIWKTTLQGLIEEVIGPIYITATQVGSVSESPGNGSIPTVAFAVWAAGFNSEGRVVELRIQQPRVISVFDEEIARTARANSVVFADLKKRLQGIGVEIRDGAISEQPVIGTLE
jgi:hypothetical protein